MASMATSPKLLVFITMLLAVFAHHAIAKTHYYDWEIQNTTLTRNCHTVTVATVNGISPGPTIEIVEGDTLVITVHNKQIYPVTMHWHGIRQFRQNYVDGPAFITQCPIQEGGSQIYQFTVENQRGTFFYHAHIDWLRATVHGALIIHPKSGELPPSYGVVEKEFPIIIGEWFGENPNVFERGFLYTPNPDETATSITPTLNGNPGPEYNCSKGPEKFVVRRHKTYLLRLINAALNDDYWFSVAHHKLTVVGQDGNVLKPFTVNYVPIQPGQTIDVLLHASKKAGNYYFGIDVGPVTLFGVPPPRIPALAVFEYVGAPSETPKLPTFPNNVTLGPVNKYWKKLRAYGESVRAFSEKVDQDLLYSIGTAFTECIPSEHCPIGPNGTPSKIMGMMQNITFDLPVRANILQAYETGQNGVFTPNFPDRMPTLKVNLTTGDAHYFYGSRGTRVKELNFGDVVRIVYQNVQAAGILDHPVHLHGHNFGVIGRGYGVYNPEKDPKTFNLVDPPMANTFGVPNGGWLAIQFVANNPGVWLTHCHFERHTAWGMEMVFITKNGKGALESLPPPIHPLPQC